MNIGEVIREKRLEKGLSQKQLAKLVGCAEITIRQYENGSREPRLERLKKIANALNVPLNELISEEGLFVETIKEYLYFDNEKGIIRNYRLLNDIGKKEAQKRVEELTELSRYTEKETKQE